MRVLRYIFGDKKRIERALIATGLTACAAALFYAVYLLCAAPVGSYGALERRVCACIETALGCLLVSHGGAAALELLGK